jgi:GT2 family glycosyltransferase
MERVLAAIVLYRMEAAASPAYRSFCETLAGSAALRKVFRLVVFDNSPEPQTLLEGCAEEYIHDGSNPGLAKPYMQALAQAAASDVPWLLVLDQDTVVTETYLAEAAALTETQAQNHRVVAIVPKLIQDGEVQSPHTVMGFRPSRAINPEQRGEATEELHAFNSGSLMRVASLQAMGGFPQQYPMEYLDYATFRLLQRGGGRIYVMATMLEHELAMRAMLRAPEGDVPERMRRVFAHELRFYRELGTPGERVAHRLRLAFRAAKAFRNGAYRRGWILLRFAARGEG